MNSKRMEHGCAVLHGVKLGDKINEMENRIVQLEQGGGGEKFTKYYQFSYPAAEDEISFNEIVYTFKRNPTIGDIFIAGKFLHDVDIGHDGEVFTFEKIGTFKNSQDIDLLSFVDEVSISESNLPYASPIEIE